MNNTLPVDGASITNVSVIGTDIEVTWEFWQNGTSVTATFTYPYTGGYGGINMIYLTLNCADSSKTLYTYNFIDTWDFTILYDQEGSTTQNTVVYPNPADEIIYIKGVANENIVEIFNLKGICILKDYNTNRLDVSNLDKGLYFIKITTNRETDILRVIVE